MSKIKPASNNEIDLVAIIHQLWKDKWIIIISILLSFIVFKVYDERTDKKKSFDAITSIKPITYNDSNEYNLLNLYYDKYFDNSKFIINIDSPENTVSKIKSLDNVNFEEVDLVTADLLHNLFIEQIEKNEKILVNSFIKNDLLERDNFDNDQDFQKAIMKEVSKVEIIKSNEKFENQKLRYPIIKFSFNNEDKWRMILNDILYAANENVRTSIVLNFNSFIESMEFAKTYELEDLKNRRINLVKDYDDRTANRLAYLEEQAAIARRLEISKNTIEAQLFNTPASTIANIITEIPFYMRGFEAIEKEIELISRRQNKELYIGELLGIDKKVREITQNDSVNRIKYFFSTTPLGNGNFKSVVMEPKSTKFFYSYNPLKVMIFTLMLGGLFGIFISVISNIIRK